MRKRIYEIIETADSSDKISRIYDVIMLVVIVLSLLPLMFYEQNEFLQILDKIAVVVFIIDYLLRLFTADYKLNKRALSFFLYPFTPMAIIDLLAILPSFDIIAPGFRVLKIFRLLRSLRVFRALKIIRYSKSFEIIGNVVKSQKKPLVSVGILALGYVFISALIMFNVEPATFQNRFFYALYWSTISLTTMGYGDISPISDLGRLTTMISSLVGIAIVALPSSIITAGYMSELQNSNKTNDEE